MSPLLLGTHNSVRLSSLSCNYILRMHRPICALRHTCACTPLLTSYLVQLLYITIHVHSTDQGLGHITTLDITYCIEHLVPLCLVPKLRTAHLTYTVLSRGYLYAYTACTCMHTCPALYHRVGRLYK